MNQLVAITNAPPIASLNFSPPMSETRERRAYARTAVEFFELEARGVTQITAVESVHVAA